MPDDTFDPAALFIGDEKFIANVLEVAGEIGEEFLTVRDEEMNL